jgi:peptidyl-prolyl cis-trans isomerase SurA
MSVGQTTEPERVPEGLQIVAICGKSAIAGQTKASVEARSELTSERGQLMARRYLRDLRSDAVIDIR